MSGKEFKQYGGEDVDMCWRLGEAGYNIIRVPNVYVHHFEHSSMTSNKRSINDMLKNSNLVLYKKWGNHLDEWIDKITIREGDGHLNDYPFIKLFLNLKHDRKPGVF